MKGKAKMKYIGVSTFESEKRFQINSAYMNSFTTKDSVAFAIGNVRIGNGELMTKQDKKDLKDYTDSVADKLDALVLSGGGDINPLTYKQSNFASSFCDSNRDRTELALMLSFIEAQKPIMGICRGFQLLGNHFKLPNFIQEIGHYENHDSSAMEIKARIEPFHKTFIRGRFQEFIKSEKEFKECDSIRTNSMHHQGFVLDGNRDPEKWSDLTKTKRVEEASSYVKNAEEKNDLLILAHTNSVIEGFEHTKLPIFGVQWHPEEYGPNSVTIQYFLKNFLFVEPANEQPAQV